MSPSFLHRDGERLLIELHVVPRAAKTRLVGEHGGRLKVQVAAPPVDGAANRELVEHFARKLGMPRTAVEIVRGSSGRQKTLAVAGLEEAELLARLGNLGHAP